MRTSKPPCPALAKRDDGTFWCGLVMCPEVAMHTTNEKEDKDEDARYWARRLGNFLRDNVFNFGKGCDWY